MGAAMTVPATFLALLPYTGGTLYPYLVPTSELLSRLPQVMETWPGALNMAIASALNGGIYAVSAGALGALIGMRRNGDDPPPSCPL